jgi:hypothetical protein
MTRPFIAFLVFNRIIPLFVSSAVRVGHTYAHTILISCKFDQFGVLFLGTVTFTKTISV